MDVNDRAGGRRLDAVAVERALRRMAARPEPPWLHLEAARRLAERLAPMRIEPARVLDWGAGPGGGRDALRQRYPKAEIVAVEPDPSWQARARRSSERRWWSLGRAQVASAHVAGEPDAALGRAQLVWANMVLHGVIDPPALFARWHELLGVDGFVAFSCLGRERSPSCASSTPRSAGRRRRPASSTCTISATCSSPPASPTRCSTRRR
jgi:malonyl-CoA O-methyltransferase